MQRERIGQPSNIQRACLASTCGHSMIARASTLSGLCLPMRSIPKVLRKEQHEEISLDQRLLPYELMFLVHFVFLQYLYPSIQSQCLALEIPMHELTYRVGGPVVS